MLSDYDLRQRRKKMAEDIVKWYEGRVLPVGPFKMAKWQTMNNAKLFAERSINVLKEGRLLSMEFVASYHRLNELKKYIENVKD